MLSVVQCEYHLTACVVDGPCLLQGFPTQVCTFPTPHPALPPISPVSLPLLLLPMRCAQLTFSDALFDTLA